MDQDLSAQGALRPTLVVRALVDPVVEAHGFAPTSHYVEATGSE
ncbi:MAG TPA: hypothetical protein VGR26_19210 [Acidimicrobiales bacterium]|nr:hypothetical protein [Acidimicrobiales bacterium]